MSGDVFIGAYFAGLTVGSAIRIFYVVRNRSKNAPDRKRTRDPLLFGPSLGMFVTPILYAQTPWLDFANYRLPVWAGWLGAGLFAVALWLLWRSHADLGRNWSPVVEIQEKHTLVTDGVYRYIRHPMYASHLLWGIAQCLLLQNWIAGWNLLVAMIPFCWVRIPREEKMMLDNFGDVYRDYMQRTGALIPHFWR